MRKKYKQLYVVIKGRVTGVFDKWGGNNGAEASVKGFSSPEFRGKFYHLEDAVSYYKKRCNENPVVHFEIEEDIFEKEDDDLEYMIYAIRHPLTGDPFYVGQTQDLEPKIAAKTHG